MANSTPNPQRTEDILVNLLSEIFRGLPENLQNRMVGHAHGLRHEAMKQRRAFEAENLASFGKGLRWGDHSKPMFADVTAKRDKTLQAMLATVTKKAERLAAKGKCDV